MRHRKRRLKNKKKCPGLGGHTSGSPFPYPHDLVKFSEKIYAFIQMKTFSTSQVTWLNEKENDILHPDDNSKSDVKPNAENNLYLVKS